VPTYVWSILAALIGLAVGWAIALRRIRELEQANSKRGADQRRVLDEAKAEARAILDRAHAEADKERDARLLEADARVSACEARLHDAKAQVKTAEVEAKELLLRARQQAEEDAKRASGAESRRVQELEQRLGKREQVLREKEDLLATRELDLTRRERSLQSRDQQLAAQEAKAADLVAQQAAKLEHVAGLKADEARSLLIEQYKDDARRAAAGDAKRIEDDAREEAEKRAKRILAIAVQRFAGEHVQDRSVTSVPLPNDELKGRIIGREGRNIRALQEATGVDFIVDDTPETIVVSSFDPIRREVARIALEKLVLDGRIHPTRIEEVVAKSQEEVERATREAAEQAMLELSVTRVHPELVKLLGRLRYRYSYAQNVLRHSVEAGFIAGLMAGELGLNVRQARRAGLLHDIGKAVSHEQEGGHAVVGSQLARKYGEDEIVCNAIACHHEDEPCRSILGHLVSAADTVSGARPGARREMLESYVRRLEDLERISAAFKGVERAFAIQAGREVRVLVEPTEVSDAESALLAREIAKKIEESLSYPGQIRVTVVRETRSIEYAK
jgi:ribonuclease Y